MSISKHYDLGQLRQKCANKEKELDKAIEKISISLDNRSKSSIDRHCIIDMKSKKLTMSLEKLGFRYKEINQICKSKKALEEAVTFDLTKMLNHSPFSSSNNHDMILQRFQISMHSLAENWDKWVNEKRSEEDRGSHYFFLTYEQEKKNIYDAMIYNKQLDPDQRIIPITVPLTDSYFDYMPILYEMGRFIGGRMREFRVDDLADFSWMYFLNKIYDKCKEHYHLPENLPLHSSTDFHDQASLQLCRKITAYLLVIYSHITRIWKEEKEKNPISHCERYAYKTVMSCFFLLENTIGEKATDFWTEFENVMEIGGIPVLNYDEYYSDAYIIRNGEPFDKEVFNYIKKTVISLVSAINEEDYDIVNDIVNCIEDPIADCFMVNIGNLNASEYLMVVLQQNWYIWLKLKKQKPGSCEEFCTFCMKNLPQRVFPILFTLYLGNNDILSKNKIEFGIGMKDKYIKAIWVKIKQLFDDQINKAQHRDPSLRILLVERSDAIKRNNKEKIDAINKQLRLLDVKEVFELDYHDSLIPLSNYIKKVYFQHEHYLEVRNNPEPAIQTIRLFKCKTDCVLRFRLWKHDRSQKTDLRIKYN